MGWNYLSLPKLQRFHRWSLVMAKYFHPTFYNGCNYLYMLGLKSIHFSKMGHRYHIELARQTILYCIWFLSSQSPDICFEHKTFSVHKYNRIAGHGQYEIPCLILYRIKDQNGKHTQEGSRGAPCNLACGLQQIKLETSTSFVTKGNLPKLVRH